MKTLFFRTKEGRVLSISTNMPHITYADSVVSDSDSLIIGSGSEEMSADSYRLEVEAKVRERYERDNKIQAEAYQKKVNILLKEGFSKNAIGVLLGESSLGDMIELKQKA